MPPLADALGLAELVQLGVGGVALVVLIFAFARGWIVSAGAVRRIEAGMTKLAELERRRGDEWKATAEAEGKRADRAEDQRDEATQRLFRAAGAWEAIGHEAKQRAIERTGDDRVAP